MQGAPLSKFMETHGALRLFEFNINMFRWYLDIDSLNDVREEMEDSGLILSSEIEPLQFSKPQL